MRPLQANFCPCSHPYVSFAATRGPPKQLGSNGLPTITARQADLSHALDDIKATINKHHSKAQYVTIFEYGWCDVISASKLLNKKAADPTLKVARTLRADVQDGSAFWTMSKCHSEGAEEALGDSIIDQRRLLQHHREKRFEFVSGVE